MSDISGMGSAFSSALGYLGQMETNEQNLDIFHQGQQFSAAAAQQTRDFQERMRGSQYQAAVNDLKTAGLNPMLAYQQGGAGTPQGATAQSPTPPVMGNKMAAGMTSAANTASLLYTNAQTDKAKAEADLARAEAANKPVQATQLTASAGHLDAQRDNIRQEMTAFEERWQKLVSETREIEAKTEKHGADVDLKDAERRRILQDMRENMKAQAAKLSQEARLLKLKEPEAIAEARFFGGPDSKAAIYFRHAPKNLTSAFTGALGAAADDVRNFTNQFQLRNPFTDTRGPRTSGKIRGLK